MAAVIVALLAAWLALVIIGFVVETLAWLGFLGVGLLVATVVGVAIWRELRDPSEK